MKVEYPVRGKVRIGERRVSASGKEYPASTDYFVSDDAEVPAKESTLRIVLPYDTVEENFSTGLEWWYIKEGKSRLACYTKDGGPEPVALRMEPFVREGEAVGEKRDSGRVPIRCLARECPEFKAGKCKPMGRLTFFIEGGRRDEVLRLDTKSFNSIEALLGVLQGAAQEGSLKGRVFWLGVRMVEQGQKKFPVLKMAAVPA